MMDNTTTAEESCSLLSFRIRCPRSRKRAVRESREKQMIKLQREERNLWKMQKDLGFEPLNPPVQRGFIRTFVLRSDVANGADAACYEKILGEINTRQYHPDRHFLEKKRQNGRKTKVPIEQRLYDPVSSAFRDMGFSEKEVSLFERYPFYTAGDLVPKWYYRFREPWRFVLRIRPYLIDKRKVQSVEIESRMQEVSNYLDGRYFRCRLDRMKGIPVPRYRREIPRPPRKRGTTAQWMAVAREENIH